MNIPGSYSSRVQLEESSFKDAISEGMMKKIGSIVNKALTDASPITIGEFELSMLTESQFLQEKYSDEWLHAVPDVQAPGGDASKPIWILADGRDVRGADPVGHPEWKSKYFSLYGFTNVPDLRGAFFRCKLYDAAALRDDHGDLSVGTFEASRIENHAHGTVPLTPSPSTFRPLVNASNTPHARLSPTDQNGYTLAPGFPSPAFTDMWQITVNPTGIVEARPKNITVNIFIKIN